MKVDQMGGIIESFTWKFLRLLFERLPSWDSFSKLFVYHTHNRHDVGVCGFLLVEVRPQVILQVLTEL